MPVYLRGSAFFWGHIRCCGNGCLGFRPDGGSLLKSPEAGPVKSKQNALAPPLGASLRLGTEWWGKSVLVTFGALLYGPDTWLTPVRGHSGHIMHRSQGYSRRRSVGSDGRSRRQTSHRFQR